MIFFAPASANQNDLLEKEAIDAGATDIKLESGGLYFRGDLEAAYRFCLWTRFATRVLVMIHQKDDITSSDDFFDYCKTLPWENFLSIEKTFSIQETVSNCPWVQNSHFAAIRLKDAIVDRLRSLNDGQRPNVDRDNPDITFFLHINNEECSFYIDFSGKELSRRGYRKAQTEAVLSEFLASSVIRRSEWSKNQSRNLLDPFCGSGTLCIEAALMASNTAPGTLNPDKFAFLRLPFHDDELWQRVLSEADEAQTEPKAKILGWDISPKAIEIAKSNAARAGVDQWVDFECRDFLKTESAPWEDGCVITDPPYGFRMQAEGAIEAFYLNIGKTFNTLFGGWDISILCGQKELLSFVNMKPSRTNTLYNGGSECQLAHYYVFTQAEKDEMIRRAEEKKAQRLAEPLSEGAQMIYNRLVKNMAALKPIMDEKNVSCYRIYDADMPEYSAAIDFYEGKWLVIAEYQAPRTIDPEDAKRRFGEIVDAAERATGLDMSCIYLKRRQIHSNDSQYERADEPSKFYICHEGSHAFMVNFTSYLDTGIFLDHRPVRALIEKYSKDARFLNLFCYTGTATVYAACGKALSTVSVDASATYLDWAQKNMEINGQTGINHFFYKDDCIGYLEHNNDTFDLIFCDPPTFSNSKSRDAFDVQEDQGRLIALCMQHLDKEGLLIFSTNFTRFKLDEYIEDQYQVLDVSEETIGEDFARNPSIHKCFLIKHKKAQKPSAPDAERKVIRKRKAVIRKIEGDKNE